MSKVNTNLMQKGDYVVDNMGHIEDVLRFLEETAFWACCTQEERRLVSQVKIIIGTSLSHNHKMTG